LPKYETAMILAGAIYWEIRAIQDHLFSCLTFCIELLNHLANIRNFHKASKQCSSDIDFELIDSSQTVDES